MNAAINLKRTSITDNDCQIYQSLLKILQQVVCPRRWTFREKTSKHVGFNLHSQLGVVFCLSHSMCLGNPSRRKMQTAPSVPIQHELSMTRRLRQFLPQSCGGRIRQILFFEKDQNLHVFRGSSAQFHSQPTAMRRVGRRDVALAQSDHADLPGSVAFFLISPSAPC